MSSHNEPGRPTEDMRTSNAGCPDLERGGSHYKNEAGKGKTTKIHPRDVFTGVVG